MIQDISLKSAFIFIVIVTACLLQGYVSPQAGLPGALHRIRVNSPADTKEFFRYTKDRIPFVSAHRGGPGPGYPENCIPTFEHTLQNTFAILEIDPRFTKDSAIVVMHDATLQRTSNGSGRVADYTLEQLKKLRLKDTEGKSTSFSIPTLDEVLQWAKGKTILVIDAKDVPIETRVKKIEENGAEANAIVIVYSYEDARKCYELNKNIVMELMVPNRTKLEEIDALGVPWSNIIAFVTHTRPEDASIFELIHAKGAMCIVGSSRTVDRAYVRGEITSRDSLQTQYRNILVDGADVIEADLAIEAGKAIADKVDPKSARYRFFKKD